MTVVSLCRYEMSGYPPGNEPTNWGDWIEPEHRRAVAEMWDRVFSDSPEAMETAEWRFMNGRWGELRLTVCLLKLTNDQSLRVFARSESK